MPITVGGTTITFNDGTTQSTAGGAPTTAQVLSATAGATAGAVGTYTFAYLNNNAATAFGGTVAGSSLLVGSTYTQGGCCPYLRAYIFTNQVSGTWRCMGRTPANGSAFTVWLRIS